MKIIQTKIKFINKTNKDIELLSVRGESPYFYEPIQIDAFNEDIKEGESLVAKVDGEGELFKFGYTTECLFREPNLVRGKQDPFGRVFLQTPILNINEEKEIEIHDGYFTCDGKVLPLPAPSSKMVRERCNEKKDTDFFLPNIGEDESTDSSQSLSEFESEPFCLGLINHSGRYLFVKVENRNCKKQLFFTLSSGFYTYTRREYEQVHMTYSAESPLDPKSTNYLVSNGANYLIDSNLFLTPVTANGNVRVCEMHFDEKTKWEENTEIVSSLNYIQFTGPELKNDAEKKNFWVRLQRKAYGDSNFQPLYEKSERGLVAGELKFIRESGEFKLAVGFNQKNKYTGLVFKVQTGSSYKFTADKELFNLENQTKVEPLDPLKETFHSEPFSDDELNVDYNNPEAFKNTVYYDNQVPVFNRNEAFVDHYFPPENRVITSRDTEGNRMKMHFPQKNDTDFSMCLEPIINSDSSHFLRAGDFFEGNYNLFKNAEVIDHTRIVSKSEELKFVRAVIMMIASKPELIRSIFKTTQKNPKGFYELYYYERNRERKIMFLDDNFLCHLGSPYFSKGTKDNEIWPMLMEKAVAKYEGGYSNLWQSNLEDLYIFFTGKEHETIKKFNLNYKEKWDSLVGALKGGNLVCANSWTNVEGLIMKLPYVVLDAKHYTENENDLKLVMLRSTGNKWQGNYSESSPLWTDELKSFFNYEYVKGKDGIFWMPYKSFGLNFDTVLIFDD